MFKIGEFSKLGQVSARMLRHYDNLGLLEPEEIDEWTGYRYYTIQQLSRLHRIIALKEMGLSLQQIGELLNADDELPADQLRGMLALKRAELAQSMREMEQRLVQVESRLARLEHEDEPSPYEIVVRSVAALPVASLTLQVPHINEMGYYCQTLTQALYRKMNAAGLSWEGPEMLLYHTEEYRETDLEVSACIGLAQLPEAAPSQQDDLVFTELPGHELVASLIYEGPFAEITSAVLELLRWGGMHRHVPAGPLRELHLSGPAHPEKPTAEIPVVELQLPIAPVEINVG